ncbi:MAG: tyrosine-type recombinase/integrase [Bacteroidota bacterium]
MWRSTRSTDRERAIEIFDDLARQWQLKHGSSVSSFFSNFLDRAPLSYSSKTVRIYRQTFKNFTRLVGDKLLRNLTPFDIEDFKMRRAHEVSSVTVNMELRTLRAAFNNALDLKVISDNPFCNTKLVREPVAEATYLTRKDFSKLLSAIFEPAFRDLVEFSAYTMMRRGEVVNLRWARIDLARREIRIESNGEFRVKGGRPRVVPMNDWVVSCLERLPRRGEYVFTRSDGSQLKPGSLSHKFKKYIGRANLDPRVHWHSLRHTGISWLIEKGVPPAFVQRIAGHSSPLVTQLYTHFEDSTLHLAMSQMN